MMTKIQSFENLFLAVVGATCGKHKASQLMDLYFVCAVDFRTNKNSSSLFEKA